MQELTGKLPSTVFAVCGGGSNLSAISYPYYNEKRVDIFGIESAGKGISSGAHAATITGKAPITIEKRLKGAEAVGDHKTSMLQDLEAKRPWKLMP